MIVTKKASIREQKEAARQAGRLKAREAARGGPRKSLGSILGRSFGTGVLTTALSYYALDSSPDMGFDLDPQLQQLILVLAFAISFLFAFLILINKHSSFSDVSSRVSGRGNKNRTQAPEEKWGGALTSHSARYDKVFDIDTAKKVAAPASLDESTSFGGDPENGAPVLAKPDGGPDASEPASSDTENEAAKLAGEEDNPERIMFGDRLAIVLDDLKRAMNAISTMLNGRNVPLDEFAKFGLNLLFAGLCARLTKHYELEASEGQGLLSRLMELTGSDSDSARAFSDSVNMYGEVDAFRSMIDKGGTLMTDMLEAPDGDGSGMSYAFGAALQDWESAEPQPPLPTTSVFMFTEIVDFKGLIGELDEPSIKRITTQHDTTVRDSLNRYSGEEIRHTGEGILARFEHARAAIDGAVDMVQQMDLFSRQNPDVGFDMRVGMHIGAAIEDSERFLGNAVQTAALVCNEAGGSEIWVSADMWNACPAYADDLKYCGEFTLEGLETSKELYTMLWEPLVDPKDRKVDYKDIGKRN